MKRASCVFILCLALFSILFFPCLSHTQKPENGDDKTLSPYFFVKSDNPSVDRLPLKSTSAIASISGVIADVTVTQVYKNEGRKRLEAIYVFPASTRAAVYGMKMVIGKRVIEAKIKKRDEARKDYEDAKKQGKSASLLEQQRPNVFQMNVANIMPGDEIRVELKYTELLVPADKVYEFVYPTVTGPRYSNRPANGVLPSDKWVQSPYLHEGEKVPFTFDMTVNVSAGMPIKDLASSSHKVNTVFSGPQSAKVTLAGSEKNGGNKDYILRYRLSGDKIQSGLLLYEGEKENFFLYMLQPPKVVKVAQIPGREYIFVVDVSGSMWGFPLDISKRLLKSLIGNLRPKDTFNVLLFSGASRLMSERSLPATKENIDKAIDVIDKQQGGGGTEFLPALNRSLKLPRLENYSRSIIVVTDGYVMVEEDVFDLIRSNLNHASIFAFGIGTSVNRHIIEGMAHVGMGEPFIITKPADTCAQAEKFRQLIESPVLTKVKVSFKGFEAYDVEPPAIPDVRSDRPVIVFGKWKGKPTGTITVTGMSGNGTFSESVNVSMAKPAKENRALRYLWARHRITLLSDYNRLRSNDERIREVTEFGLAYNLLTAYTSFVALDSQVRKMGDSTKVSQSLPMPEGISDHAIGGANGGLMRAMTLPSTVAAPGPSQYGALGRMETAAVKEKARKDSETKGSRAPKVSLGDVITTGSIIKKSAEATIKVGLGNIEACLAASTEPVIYSVSLTVNPDGTVKTVKINTRTRAMGAWERCVTDILKKLVFAPTKDGKEASMTISIYVTP